jgi:DNA (cytosine-5)-methyltransferase 1
MNRKAVDLFCGCGGLSLGLRRADFNVVAGIDGWQDAITVYSANNANHLAIQHDLSDEDSTVEIVAPHNPFLIAGGPPCQDFSSAGGRVEGTRAELTVKFANVIERVGPAAFIMENVPRARNSAAFRDALQVFRRAGYGLTMIVLNAALCGVPQARKRLFLIGLMGEPDDFLLPSLEASMSSTPMTIRQYDPDLVGFDFYYRHPRTYFRKAIYSIDEPSPTIRGINRPKPSTYKMHDADSHPPSDDRVKSLDLEQRARLQTFPPRYFDVKVSKAAKEQMIGNAVPVELAHFVASALNQYIDEKADGGYALDLMVQAKDIARNVVERVKEFKDRYEAIGRGDEVVERVDPQFVRDIYRILAKLPKSADNNSKVMSFATSASPSKLGNDGDDTEEPQLLQAAE